MPLTWKMIVLLFFIIVGCVRVTPYKKMSGDTCCGYRDQHLKNNLYMVTFSGSVQTDRATVTGYAYRRAEEVCKENGYRDYEVLNEVQSGNFNTYTGSELPNISLKIECKK